MHLHSFSNIITYDILRILSLANSHKITKRLRGRSVRMQARGYTTFSYPSLTRPFQSCYVLASVATHRTRAVAQGFSVQVWGTWGRRFKSAQPDQGNCLEGSNIPDCSSPFHVYQGFEPEFDVRDLYHAILYPSCHFTWNRTNRIPKQDVLIEACCPRAVRSIPIPFVLLPIHFTNLKLPPHAS